MNRPRVLVVDDSPSNRKLISKLLGKAYVVDEAGGADEAKVRMAAARPDLVLLDLGLPGVPGLDLAASLKADPKTKEITLVAVTAYAMPEDEKKARAAGCVDFITKPINTRTFEDRVRTALEAGPPADKRQTSLRVLVVDDDPSGRKVIAAALTGGGHQVMDASDGVAALSALRGAPFDLVVCDLLMPRMDGFALCKEIRQDPSLKGIRILAYSATFTDRRDLEVAKRMGADDVLGKPAPSEELLTAVESVISRDPAASGVPDDEPVVMRQYNQALVQKLEKKMIELREINQGLEDRVRSRTQELEGAVRELEAFSGSASHDLRSPIRRINGYASLLQRNFAASLGAEAAEYVQRILAECEAMGALVNSLLSLGEARNTPLKGADVDLSVLAEDIVTKLREAEPARRVEVVIPPGLKTKGDPTLIRSLLSNLLENAWKFTASKSDARIELGHGAVPGEDVFFVRDNGAGFDPAQREKLFKPFQRLHAKVKGTGLGLAIAARIIERHGGNIWAESLEGKGATFYFSLPKKQSGAG